MRIQYIVSCRYDTNDVNVRFMTLLEEHICKYDNIEMVDKALILFIYAEIGISIQ